MPRRRHLTGLRAGSIPSDSESISESDSDAGQHPSAGRGVQRIARAPARFAVNTQVHCPGCGRKCANLNILKAHRNSHLLANQACRAAASAMKRPRIVRLPRPGAAGGADSDGDDPGDRGAFDLIDRMRIGDGDRGMAPEAAAVDPSRYPRHGDVVSGLNIVCIMCVKRVRSAPTTTDSNAPFSAGARPVRRPSRAGYGSALG
jgi:hypothetical protein